jgi:hypothetical protein
MPSKNSAGALSKQALKSSILIQNSHRNFFVCYRQSLRFDGGVSKDIHDVCYTLAIRREESMLALNSHGGTRLSSKPETFCGSDMSQLRYLVTGFPTQRPGFELRSRHVGFMVEKIALE